MEELTELLVFLKDPQLFCKVDGEDHSARLRLHLQMFRDVDYEAKAAILKDKDRSFLSLILAEGPIDDSFYAVTSHHELHFGESEKIMLGKITFREIMDSRDAFITVEHEDFVSGLMVLNTYRGSMDRVDEFMKPDIGKTMYN